MLNRRRRLSRELYDSVTQLLFSTMLLARASHIRLQRSGGAGTPELPQMLADLENMSAMALAQMRTLLSELQAQEPGWEALMSALREQADSDLGRLGSQIDVLSCSGVPVDDADRTEMFRISIEALVNAAESGARAGDDTTGQRSMP